MQRPDVLHEAERGVYSEADFAFDLLAGMVHFGYEDAGHDPVKWDQALYDARQREAEK